MDLMTVNGKQPMRLLALVAVMGLLAGCEEGPNMAFLQPKDKAETPAETSKSTKLVERDVEAPDVFDVNEAALWDGRPSLGGVWVAHPDVTDPERVIIRNPTNGKFVIGALFRREREIPGPRIQVSSDAAQALSMLAGAPVELFGPPETPDFSVLATLPTYGIDHFFPLFLLSEVDGQAETAGHIVHFLEPDLYGFPDELSCVGPADPYAFAGPDLQILFPVFLLLGEPATPVDPAAFRATLDAQNTACWADHPDVLDAMYGY